MTETEIEELKTQAKHWEDLYYKENDLVGLLKAETAYLRAEVDYLKSKIAYMKKYKE